MGAVEMKGKLDDLPSDLPEKMAQLQFQLSESPNDNPDSADLQLHKIFTEEDVAALSVLAETLAEKFPGFTFAPDEFGIRFVNGKEEFEAFVKEVCVAAFTPFIS